MEAGPSRVIRWRTAITAIHTDWAVRQAGRGHGRQTVASCITAPLPILPVNPGTVNERHCTDGKKWMGQDVADYNASAPGSNVGPFIMNPEGVAARLFSIDKMNDGPFPEHYEPIESPIGTNPLHPDVISSPVARVFKEDLPNMGKVDEFPYVATTYSIELFRHWTKHRA